MTNHDAITKLLLMMRNVKDGSLEDMALKKAISALEAQDGDSTYKELYEILVEYFHGDESMLKDKKEFRMWLERMHWHVLECDKLARELEAIKAQDGDCISRSKALEIIEEYIDEYDDLDQNGLHNLKWCAMCEAKIVLERLPSVQPEIIRCKDCKHFYFDKPYVIQGIPVLGHEVCDAWGDGCKTAQDGYCFMAKRKEDE